MAAPRYYTAEMVRAFPDDGNRYEVVHGELLLSPSSVRADRFTKRRLYQEMGIPDFWVVDADAHEVEMWTPSSIFPVVEREQLTWLPAGAGEPFRLSLSELFQPL